MQASTSSMQKPSARSLPSLSVRIDLDPEGRIGPGKIALLENIDKHGSVQAAGRAAGTDANPRRGADGVRPLAGQALPQDRARRDQRVAQGVAGAAARDRQAEKAGGVSAR